MHWVGVAAGAGVGASASISAASTGVGAGASAGASVGVGIGAGARAGAGTDAKFFQDFAQVRTCLDAVRCMQTYLDVFEKSRTRLFGIFESFFNGFSHRFSVVSINLCRFSIVVHLLLIDFR